MNLPAVLLPTQIGSHTKPIGGATKIPNQYMKTTISIALSGFPNSLNNLLRGIVEVVGRDHIEL